MPYVWIDDDVDTKLMNRYVKSLREMLLDPDGPHELGILQLCEELDCDANLYSAVWAHLDHWMRSRIKDIRDRFPKQDCEPVVRVAEGQANVITDESIKF